MRINCKHFDEAISLEDSRCTIIVIENPKVMGNIQYSLIEDGDDYFSVYDEEFKPINSKNIITILNPISFDFEDRKIKTIVNNYLIDIFNNKVEFKNEVEESFYILARTINDFFNDNSSLEFVTPSSYSIKDILKAIDINVDFKDVVSVYEKVMLILNMLNEMTDDKVIFIVNLSMLVSKEEYLGIVEMINLHSLKVVLIEGSKQFLENVDYYYMDYDFCLSKNNVDMV